MITSHKSTAGGVISQLVNAGKQKTNTLHEDEQQALLSNEDNETISETSSIFEKKFISIEGMTCGACSACIEKLFRGIDGVESGTVSLMLKRAEVIFNPNEISLD